MKKAVGIVCVCLVGAMPVYGQGRGQAPPPSPATDTVAPEIPGVVKAGTKVIVIKDDFQGTEGPIALPDGTVAFTEGARTGSRESTRTARSRCISITPTGRTPWHSTRRAASLPFKEALRMSRSAWSPPRAAKRRSPTTSRATPTISSSPRTAACISRCQGQLRRGERPAVHAVRAGCVLHRFWQRQGGEGR